MKRCLVMYGIEQGSFVLMSYLSV